MIGSYISLLLLAASISLLGYPILRRETRRSMLLLDVLVHAGLLVAVFEEILTTSVLVGCYLGLRLGGLIALSAVARRFAPVAPWRFAMLAGAVYLSLIPQVTQWPLDGDEPYYLLISNSILSDGDLDLRNQYEDSPQLVGRTIGPQYGDPEGAAGELFSRHEPFLSLVLAPAVAIGGRSGALVFLALIAAMLIFSVARLLDEEEIPPRARAIALGFFAFGPPVIFYATRVWPELLAALCFVEALRSLRDRRFTRMALITLPLALLKLRYLAIVAPLLVIGVMQFRREDRTGSRILMARLLIASVVIILPMVILWRSTGDASSVHSFDSFRLGELRRYWLGAAGLVVDAQAGLLFQAPFLALGLFAMLSRRVRESSVLRLGALAALPYLFLLFPRAEWHGGWSPPLRYIVVLSPLLALAAASLVALKKRALFDLTAIAACMTLLLAAHGVGSPFRLFHIANGESVFGEWLSAATHLDYSRFLPSTIRENVAALLATILIVVTTAVVWLARKRNLRMTSYGSIPAITLAATLLFLSSGRRAGSVVHLEDAHVIREGGMLFPAIWQPERFLYDGGWVVTAGDSLRFRLKRGTATLRYHADAPTTLIWNAEEIRLSAETGWKTITFAHGGTDDVVLRCREGAVTLDHVRTE